MAGILVFIPKSTSQQPSELVRVGLGPLLDASVDAIPTPVPTGPDGGPGMLWTFLARVAGAPTSPREVNLKSQEWQPAAPRDGLTRGRFWLGYVKDARPSAGDLQRSELHEGEAVKLLDGNQWLIPIAEMLPRLLEIDPATGEETKQPPAKHRDFVMRANEVFNLFLSDSFHELVSKERRVVIPEGLTFAALALAKNYRVTREVVSLLQLIGEYEAFEVARVASGLSAVERMIAQKKSTASSFQPVG